MQPDWATTTPKVVGAVMYTGHGIAFSEESAKDRAYQEILDKIGKDLGYEIGNQYLREILATGEISSLSTSVVDTYINQQANGAWNYYVMVRTPQSVLLSSRSPDYKSLLEREAKIEDTLSETIALYRDNKDVSAINKVLEAIVISLEGDVNNPDYTSEALLEKALGYLDKLRITLSSPSKDCSIAVGVKVKRAKGLFYPPVEGATVLARYTMMDTDNNTIESSIECRTDKRGSFRFKNTNPYILRTGEVRFSILLDSSLLSKIEANAPKGFLNSLYSILAEKEVSYSYEGKKSLSPDDLLIAVALYDEEGNPIDTTSFISDVDNYLDWAKMPEYSYVSIYGDEFEDMYYSLLDEYPSYSYFIIVRVGITGFKEYQEEIHVRTEGRVLIYTNHMEEVAIQDSNIIGSGDSMESAKDDSLKKEAYIIAGRLLEVL